MIITQITMNNFFRFYSKSIIDCRVKGDKNVIVIRGENGTGKTTMLNAFYWCLYGDVLSPLSLSKMLNELAEHELPEGHTTSVYVEIVFIDKGIEYTALRKRIYKRRGTDVVQIGEEDFRITYKRENGNPELLSDPNNFFEGIIPNKLRGFFFFDGERIDRLAKIDGRDEIKQATLDILGLTKLEDLKDHFQKIEGDLTKEQKKFLTGSAKDLTEEYEVLCAERQRAEEKLVNTKENIKQVNENLQQIRTYLQNHNSTEIKRLESERASLLKDIQDVKNDIMKKNKYIQSLTTKDFKNYLVSTCFDNVFSYLEAKRQKGELPSDVKVQFIDDLLLKKECICGRPLIKGTCEYNTVLKKKSRAGRSELDSAYHKLTAYMKQQKGLVNSFFSRYYELQEECRQLEQKIELKQRRIKEIGRLLKDSDNEEIKRQESLREQFEKDKEDYSRTALRLEITLEDLKKKIVQKNREIETIQVKGAQAEACKKWRDTVVKLAQLNQEIRSYFLDYTRANLDRHIRKVFDSMKEKPYRFARLTDDFILEITNDLENDDDIRVLSTGEGQVASLAFISSLVSYAREKLEDKLMSDFSGGDFPIVMDSPFGNLSAGHKRNVAREIGNLATQVIIIVSDEQWASVVEENIMPRVKYIYRMFDGSKNSQTVGEHTEIRRYI